MLQDSLTLFATLQQMIWHNGELWVLLFPMLLIVEAPLYLLVITGIFRWSYQPQIQNTNYFPSVSFIITCYGEGDAIAITIDTLTEQIYPGSIEIIAVVDGAVQNKDTYQAARQCAIRHQGLKKRSVIVLPKWQRGGRVSTLNAGLSVAQGEIVINVDGDTSFDNNMLLAMMEQFVDRNVIASGGALRVRNHDDNLITKMQSLEYMLSMQAGKTGMARWGVLNNISGAFGAFRTSMLKQVGGWDTHTAEDLDLTMRLKQYKRRYPHIRLAFATHAVGHTDVPDTLKGLLLQRLRWDGDLLFLFLRKHNAGLSPTLLGWGNFLFTLTYGVLQNVLLPFLVVLFTLFLIITYPFKLVLSLFILLYVVYLAISLTMFIVYIGFVSERKPQDFMCTPWLLLYPIYQFFMRLVTAFSMVNELIRRGHEESTMAPWWVLKRGKKF